MHHHARAQLQFDRPRIDPAPLGRQTRHALQAALLVAEAELWLMRWRLMKQGHLKMMRWHAINRIPIV
ncbi:MAG: hypothetical protein NVS2B11_16380 [Acetobacteraceae bacterium]